MSAKKTKAPSTPAEAPQKKGGVDTKIFLVQKAAAVIDASAGIDPWKDTPDYDDTLVPTYSKFLLARFIDHRGKARGGIDAIATNVSAFGGSIVPAKGVDEESADFKSASQAAENFIRNIGCGGKSLSAIRHEISQDLERTGEAYLEVLCNARGRPVQVNPLRSIHFRITTESELVKVRRPIVEDWGDGPKLTVRIERRRFRRYAQRMEDGRVRWFKEWGDPRTIDGQTGKVVENTTDPATSIIRLWHYSSWSPYGIPPWTAALIELLGAREASELNKGSMESNAIPAMAILLSGGRLSDGSVARVEEFIRHKGQTKESFSGILLMEAEADDQTDPGSVKIDIKPLVSEQRDDSLFVNYQKDADDQFLSAIRVSDIFVGRPSADGRGLESIRRLTDEQVFAPKRDAFDDMLNNQLLIYFSGGLCRYVSRTPNVTDSTIQANILATLERTGGIGPKIAHRIASEIFPNATEGTDLSPQLDPELPYSMQLADRVKKNSGGKSAKATGKEFAEPNQSGPPVVPPIDPGPSGKQKP